MSQSNEPLQRSLNEIPDTHILNHVTKERLDGFERCVIRNIFEGWMVSWKHIANDLQSITDIDSCLDKKEIVRYLLSYFGHIKEDEDDYRVQENDDNIQTRVEYYPNVPKFLQLPHGFNLFL